MHKRYNELCHAIFVISYQYLIASKIKRVYKAQRSYELEESECYKQVIDMLVTFSDMGKQLSLLQSYQEMNIHYGCILLSFYFQHTKRGLLQEYSHLTVLQPRLALNLQWSSCINLRSAGVLVVSYYVMSFSFVGTSVGTLELALCSDSPIISSGSLLLPPHFPAVVSSSFQFHQSCFLQWVLINNTYILCSLLFPPLPKLIIILCYLLQR